MVHAQRHLIDFLGIDKLLCVAGASMGGMQSPMVAPTGTRSVGHSYCHGTETFSQQIAFNEVVRQSIMADPAWREGNYYEYGSPRRGLSVARMIGHITFMSDHPWKRNFPGD